MINSDFHCAMQDRNPVDHPLKHTGQSDAKQGIEGFVSMWLASNSFPWSFEIPGAVASCVLLLFGAGSVLLMWGFMN